MNFKRVLSSIVASSVFVTCMTNSLTMYAEEPATLAELMSDIVGIALMDIQSSSKDTAVATALSKVSISDNTVSFDGIQIGYWFEGTPTTLYSDVDKTTQLAHKTADGYELDSNLAYKLLSEVNSNIVENYVPTTSDWSKIIGKYDVTFGDFTLPADNWVPLSIKPDGIPDIYNNDDYSNYFTNISKVANWKLSDSSSSYTHQFNHYDNFCYIPYIIGTDGHLYLQGSVMALGKYNGSVGADYASMTQFDNYYWWYYYKGTTDQASASACPIIFASFGVNENIVSPYIYCTSNTRDKGTEAIITKYDATFRDISDPSLTFTGGVSDIAQAGLVYKKELLKDTCQNWSYGNSYMRNAVTSAVTKMWESQSCSKTVTGNTTLTRRLSKLSNLLATDTLEVKSTGWTINGTDNIDTYVGSQTMIEAGDTAEISSLVDADALTFDVVVPTVLPVSIDDHGVVTVASNASIKNQSGLPVKITGVSIHDKPASGWTLVQTQPSTAQGAREFNFTTSIVEGTVLDCDETLTFAYDAKLSPVMTGLENLDIASVLLTVDWAN